MRGLIVLALAALAVAVPAPLLHADSKTAIPDNFIVVFKQGLSQQARDFHVRRVKGLAGGVGLGGRFEIGTFSGYSAKLSNSTLTAVLNFPEVQYVEADQTVSIDQTCTTQTNVASWGLERTSHRALVLDGTYTYRTTAGAGVDAYIIDTGVYIQHQDFETRATWGTNTVDTNNQDCNGHGTHVAGTVGGAAWGIAKKVNIIAVKVLNCAGSGTITGVVNGVAWVAAAHRGKTRPSVANMSLGGGLSTALNQAVAQAVAAGVTFAVAAGNSNADACTFSPASEPTAISVVSTDVAQNGNNEIDIRSSFSNFGTCTDIGAPGTDITSAWIGTPTAQRTISGTSMASPHVCGVAALVVATNPTFNPAQVSAAVYAAATPGLINLNCNNNAACSATPNRLLHSTCA